jgi:phosphate acetyltransferase
MLVKIDFDFFSKKGFRNEIVEQAVQINAMSRRKIVFADSEDFILEAASLVKKKRIAEPILLGDPAKFHAAFKRLGITNLNDENILDYLLAANSDKLDEYAKEYLQMRKADGKIMSEVDALANISKPHYLGALLVKKGICSGMIAGASSATKPYYPVFEIIKLAPGVARTSGVFLMADRNSDKVFFFADCVMNMSPNSEQLAEIARLTARTAKGFGLTPKVAMLSFSTRDSAKHDSVERIKLATAMVRRAEPELIIDGEIQLDAAVSSDVMQRKCPDSPLKGNANVLVFPDLNAANIGYKLVERLGGYEAIGPFLQGSSMPVNDLSRGCSAEDVMYVAAATVIQSKICELHNAAAITPAKLVEGESEPAFSEANHKKSTSVHAAVHSRPSHASSSGHSSSSQKKYDQMDLLPSNVRKIIEESRNKTKKEKETQKD